MTGREFLKSKWIQLARRPGAAREVAEKLSAWLQRIKGSELYNKAQRLWEYFQSDRVSKANKVIILAGLLYLISPFDLVPDWIPLAGLLDDMGVATFVLQYILKKINADQTIEGIPGEEQ